MGDPLLLSRCAPRSCRPLAEARHSSRHPGDRLFDEEWNECGCFVEKPDPVYQEEADARLVFAAAYPDLPDAALPASEMSPQTLDIFAPYMRAFRLTNTRKWQHLFVAALAERLQRASIMEGTGCW